MHEYSTYVLRLFSPLCILLLFVGYMYYNVLLTFLCSVRDWTNLWLDNFMIGYFCRMSILCSVWIFTIIICDTYSLYYMHLLCSAVLLLLIILILLLL